MPSIWILCLINHLVLPATAIFQQLIQIYKNCIIRFIAVFLIFKPLDGKDFFTFSVFYNVEFHAAC